jgi:hypothetical protein
LQPTEGQAPGFDKTISLELSSTDRKEAKRAKATRLAAVDVVIESGIPADRGSFGA